MKLHTAESMTRKSHRKKEMVNGNCYQRFSVVGRANAVSVNVRARYLIIHIHCVCRVHSIRHKTKKRNNSTLKTNKSEIIKGARIFDRFMFSRINNLSHIVCEWCARSLAIMLHALARQHKQPGTHMVLENLE